MYIIKMVFASLTMSAIEVFLSRVRELSFEIDSSKLLVDTTIICENLVVSSLRICDEEFDKNPDVNKLELSIKMKDALLKSVNKAADEYVLLLKAEAKTPAEVQMNLNAYLVSLRVKLTLVDFWKLAEHRFLCEYPDTDDRNIIEAGLNYWRSRRTCSHKDDNP